MVSSILFIHNIFYIFTNNCLNNEKVKERKKPVQFLENNGIIVLKTKNISQ